MIYEAINEPPYLLLFQFNRPLFLLSSYIYKQAIWITLCNAQGSQGQNHKNNNNATQTHSWDWAQGQGFLGLWVQGSHHSVMLIRNQERQQSRGYFWKQVGTTILHLSSKEAT